LQAILGASGIGLTSGPTWVTERSRSGLKALPAGIVAPNPTAYLPPKPRIGPCIINNLEITY